MEKTAAFSVAAEKSSELLPWQRSTAQDRDSHARIHEYLQVRMTTRPTAGQRNGPKSCRGAEKNCSPCSFLSSTSSTLHRNQSARTNLHKRSSNSATSIHDLLQANQSAQEPSINLLAVNRSRWDQSTQPRHDQLSNLIPHDKDPTQ